MWGNLRSSLAQAGENIQAPGDLIAKLGDVVAPDPGGYNDDDEYETDSDEDGEYDREYYEDEDINFVDDDNKKDNDRNDDGTAGNHTKINSMSSPIKTTRGLLGGVLKKAMSAQLILPKHQIEDTGQSFDGSNWADELDSDDEGFIQRNELDAVDIGQNAYGQKAEALAIKTESLATKTESGEDIVNGDYTGDLDNVIIGSYNEESYPEKKGTGLKEVTSRSTPQWSLESVDRLKNQDQRYYRNPSPEIETDAEDIKNKLKTNTNLDENDGRVLVDGVDLLLPQEKDTNISCQEGNVKFSERNDVLNNSVSSQINSNQSTVADEDLERDDISEGEIVDEPKSILIETNGGGTDCVQHGRIHEKADANILYHTSCKHPEEAEKNTSCEEGSASPLEQNEPFDINSNSSTVADEALDDDEIYKGEAGDTVKSITTMGVENINFSQQQNEHAKAHADVSKPVSPRETVSVNPPKHENIVPDIIGSEMNDEDPMIVDEISVQNSMSEHKISNEPSTLSGEDGDCNEEEKDLESVRLGFQNGRIQSKPRDEVALLRDHMVQQESEYISDKSDKQLVAFPEDSPEISRNLDLEITDDRIDITGCNDDNDDTAFEATDKPIDIMAQKDLIANTKIDSQQTNLKINDVGPIVTKEILDNHTNGEEHYSSVNNDKNEHTSPVRQLVQQKYESNLTDIHSKVESTCNVMLEINDPNAPVQNVQMKEEEESSLKKDLTSAEDSIGILTSQALERENQQVEKLETVEHSSQNNIQILRKENESLTNELKDAKDLIVNLQSQALAKENEQANELRSLEQNNKKMQTLDKENESLRTNLKSTENLIANLRSIAVDREKEEAKKLETMEQNYVKKMNDFATATQSAATDKLERTIQDMKSSAENTIRELQQQLEGERERLAQQQQQFDRILSEVTSRAERSEVEWRNELTKQKAKLAEIQGQNSRAIFTVGEKNSEIEQLNTIIGDMKIAIKENVENTEAVEEEADELHSENEELKNKMEKTENEKKQLNNKLKKLEGEHSKLMGAQMELQMVKEEQARDKEKMKAALQSQTSNEGTLKAERDAAKAEAMDLNQQHAALQADLEVVRADYTRSVTANSNLQRAMEAFQGEREAELSLIEESRVASEQAVMASHQLALEATKQENEVAMRQVQSAADKAVSNMMEDLSSMEKKQEECRKENVNLRRSLDEAIHRLQSNQEDVIDRSFMKNILLEWYSKGGKSRREVMVVMASVLHFTDEEKDKCGIGEGSGTIGRVVGAMAPPLGPAAKTSEEIEGDTVREKWVNFLLAECGEESATASTTTTNPGNKSSRMTEATTL